jgi:hypothetical protein
LELEVELEIRMKWAPSEISAQMAMEGTIPPGKKKNRGRNGEIMSKL